MSQAIDPRTLGALEESSAPVPEGPKLTKLSSGVVLRHKRIPPMILAKLDEKYVYPKVPTVYDENGDRYLDNPNDPDYLDAIKKVNDDKGMAMMDVLIGLGTEIESIPEGMYKPEDEEWVDDLSIISGIDVPKLKVGRYLAYIKYYAVVDQKDFQEIVKIGAESLGVTEEAVATEIAKFQDNSVGGPNTGSEVPV